MTDLTISIDTTEVDALVRKFPKFERIIFDEMDAAMKGSLEAFKTEVVGRTPVNFGQLRQSIQTITRGSPPRFEGEVSTPLLYGEVVERGRKPGKMPPVDAIDLWVQRKLGVPSSESRGVAFVIARAIGRRGTQGAAMFQKGFEAGKPDMDRLWRNVPKRAAKRIEDSV